jgi:hypothetical protein
VLGVGKDPEDEERRLLVPIKSNLASPPPALAYRVAGLLDGRARVEWEPDPVGTVQADALLGPGMTEDRDEKRAADDLLRDLLADGERRVVEIFRAGRENGIAQRTLYRAKRRLGIRTRHEGRPGRPGGAWHWSLPDLAPSKTATLREVAFFEEVHEETAEVARTSPKAATSDDMAVFGGSLRPDEDEV